MTLLFTPRLLLWPLNRSILEARLQSADFSLECSLPAGQLTVHFGTDWPGDPLSAFPYLFTQLNAQQEIPGTFVAVHRQTAQAVGMLGSKGRPRQGELEIGYGFSPVVWNQGYATEALSALLPHLLDWPGVHTLTAQTAPGNGASERVLEKSGFDRTGSTVTSAGKLSGWVYRAPA
ncbi:GNAT family N-acetyltransferase [Deinococcus sp.]|uniref:GNAT family N-acetyltransferase n=1 Tax=Deinococcus sp. TaxID=47478 RepID=UPI0025C45574|nr:GNAT family N-acetyltransferase [Deinococcus sp.]